MFKFGYQKLLELYSLQEDVARRDFMESQQKLESEKGLLQSMYSLCDRAIEESHELRNLVEGAPVARLVKIDEFLDGQKIKIERQSEVIANHTRIVEQKQDILIAAAKERKILERLKEKKKEEYRKAEAKKDAKFTDEIVVTRYRGRV